MTPNVEVLYFADCPNYGDAVAITRSVLAEEGIDAPIKLIAVEMQEDAERQQFYGSPTVRVNGEDVLPPTDDQAKPTLARRLIQTAAGALTPVPPAESIRAALLRAASAS